MGTLMRIFMKIKLRILMVILMVILMGILMEILLVWFGLYQYEKLLCSPITVCDLRDEQVVISELLKFELGIYG